MVGHGCVPRCQATAFIEAAEQFLASGAPVDLVRHPAAKGVLEDYKRIKAIGDGIEELERGSQNLATEFATAKLGLQGGGTVGAMTFPEGGPDKAFATAARQLVKVIGPAGRKFAGKDDSAIGSLLAFVKSSQVEPGTATGRGQGRLAEMPAGGQQEQELPDAEEASFGSDAREGLERLLDSNAVADGAGQTAEAQAGSPLATGVDRPPVGAEVRTSAGKRKREYDGRKGKVVRHLTRQCVVLLLDGPCKGSEKKFDYANVAVLGEGAAAQPAGQDGLPAAPPLPAARGTASISRASAAQQLFGLPAGDVMD